MNMHFRVMAQLKVDYRLQVLDVNAACGNVSRHQDCTTLVGEPQQYLITVALFQITVQGKGTETFFLILLTLVYWVIHKNAGRRLFIFFLFSAWLNAFIKEIWKKLPYLR